VSDNFGLNSTMDLTSRVSLRLNMSVNRSEQRTFVSTKQFDASGTLSDRAAFDNRPAGFTFLDVVNNDLYTKLSATIGDWSASVHIEPITRQYSVNKSLQISAIPTDKTGLTLYYSSSASSDSLDIGKIGNQSLNGTLTYQPNRRTSYGLSGTVSLPQEGKSSYSATGTMSYLFNRGHQLSLNYGTRQSGGRSEDTFSGSLGLSFRKRTRVEMTYSTTNPFKENRTNLYTVRFGKSF
jgi:hypothetical protein